MSSPQLQPEDANRYVHQPLDEASKEIRLIGLEFLRDSGDEASVSPVECTIKIFDLEHAPPFTALSYVWGPPEPAHEIIVDKKTFRIRENLFNFLCEFRRIAPDTENVSGILLWIDQISIDQTSIAERGHQVRMMNEIYLSADYVIAWLGFGERRVEAKRHAQYGGTEYEAAHDYKRTGDLKFFKVLLYNEYFQRLWVAQEFVLARRVRILVKDVWLYDEVKADAELDLAQLRSESPASAYRMFQRRLQCTLRDVRLDTLEQTLGHFSTGDCEDPRDRVYGLLGLVGFQRSKIRIDYAKPPQQVYMDAFLAIISQSTTPVEPDYEKWLERERLRYSLALNVLSASMGFSKYIRIAIFAGNMRKNWHVHVVWR
ncbi:heterokaryon incompatibility protein-domain-containing protein [Phaeosphaeria sp. MPI-PUGE-AT-0046c]|nr:heterokaryon incompatibility protein-domain-containing protein [Phaeosphaeria sp. MPI-PUGE-AT-0046c]